MSAKFAFENMHISQYLRNHPINGKKNDFISGYIDLLQYFLSIGDGNQWSKSVVDLYRQTFNAPDVAIDYKPPKIKYFFWRDVLLTDLLFITSFDNKNSGDRILNNVCDFYGERYRKRLKVVYDCFYSLDTNYECLKAKNKPMLESVKQNRVFSNLPEKKIMITANMSAGKSTLLNALTGKRVNKTMNDACTAKVHSIYNKPYEDGFVYEYDYDLDLDASQDVLMDDNEENKSSRISVGTFFRNEMNPNKRIVLLDTPGVNSARDKAHKDMTDEAVKTQDCDLLIYLMNGEVIATDDEHRHLMYVKEHYSGEIIFLINKLDEYKKEDSVNGTLEVVKEYLTKFGFEKPIVYPISAYAAYLGRMLKNGEQLTEDELDDLEFRKRKLSRGEFKYNSYFPNFIDSVLDDELDRLICNSGIVELEKIIYA